MTLEERIESIENKLNDLTFPHQAVSDRLFTLEQNINEARQSIKDGIYTAYWNALEEEKNIEYKRWGTEEIRSVSADIIDLGQKIEKIEIYLKSLIKFIGAKPNIEYDEFDWEETITFIKD